MIFVEKRGGKRTFGRRRHRWEDNIINGSYGSWAEECGLDSSCSGYEPVVCCCELGNEYPVSIKDWVFLD